MLIVDFSNLLTQVFFYCHQKTIISAFETNVKHAQVRYIWSSKPEYKLV